MLRYLKCHVADDEGTGDFFGSVITLANSAIGAGVLAFPYAFKSAGLGLGLMLTLGLCGVMGYCLHIMSTSCKVNLKCEPYDLTLS